MAARWQSHIRSSSPEKLVYYLHEKRSTEENEGYLRSVCNLPVRLTVPGLREPKGCSNHTHHEQNGRQWGKTLNLHHAQDFRHVTLASTHVEETSSGEEDAVNTTKGGQGHKDGHDPPHESVQTLGKHLKRKSSSHMHVITHFRWLPDFFPVTQCITQLQIPECYSSANLVHNLVTIHLTQLPDPCLESSGSRAYFRLRLWTFWCASLTESEQPAA